MSAFPSSAVAKLNADGSLNVLTGSVEMGQGALTALAQIAAHEATLPVSRVRVSTPDTAVTPWDQMSRGEPHDEQHGQGHPTARSST